MFERFTEQARRVVVFAQEEAQTLGHNHIGAEHLLLALARDQTTGAAQALAEAGLSIDAARASLLARVPAGERRQTGQIPFTPSAKKALERSLKRAVASHAGAIAPEQLLLGVLDADDPLVVDILADNYVVVDQLRRAVQQRTTQNYQQLNALRLEVVDSILLALEHRDEVMAIVSDAATQKEAAAALRERFSLSAHGAQVVLDVRVGSFTQEEQRRLVREQAELRAKLGEGG